jgi:MbtH protein
MLPAYSASTLRARLGCERIDMAAPDDEDTTVYRVVVNHEEQYSIWPSHLDIPAGWREAGKTGLKDECLAFVREVWTDMRPLSVRQWMDEPQRSTPRTP